VTAVPPGEAVRRHYAESLELLRLADAAGWDGMICDVGSGGGYPGLVIAAIVPGTVVHLVEPLQKRARLLTWLAEELGLGNVRVHASRAEDAARTQLRDACGLVTARAVAGLSEVLEYTSPFAHDGGLVALPKGSGLDAEVEQGATAMELLGVDIDSRQRMREEVSGHIDVLLLRKVGQTNERYPRRAGMAAKRPL
jgi:16S rRNA (guanine527-N7)-methyltransferase